ncbi:MAG: biotin/lipoyl-containing protein, partial [candidate division Zixibacteria bacterium]|nr:biotin/lipoyl-containing protein [candidate division Zixibacteria bacterium]
APAPTPAAPAAAGQGAVASPIAGTVVEIKAKVGMAVKQGDILLSIEAMKMKTAIAAPTAGKVKAIPVAVGDSVRENQTLVEFE